MPGAPPARVMLRTPSARAGGAVVRALVTLGALGAVSPASAAAAVLTAPGPAAASAAAVLPNPRPAVTGGGAASSLFRSGGLRVGRPAVAERIGPLAAVDPFARDTPDPEGGSRPSTARLDRVVRELRGGPLSIDPELRWMFDDASEARVLRLLEESTVPVLVAVLPSEDEDESGGDTRRVLQHLQRGVGRPAVYVTVDQRGRFDLSSVGISRSLEIPYGLLLPPRDERPYEQQERDPRPPGWTTVPARLATIVSTARDAGPGAPNRVLDRVRPLEPLDRSDARAERNREDAIAATVVGLVLGLFLAFAFIGIRGAVRSVRDDAALRGRLKNDADARAQARRTGRPAAGGRRRRNRKN